MECQIISGDNIENGEVGSNVNNVVLSSAADVKLHCSLEPVLENVHVRPQLVQYITSVASVQQLSSQSILPQFQEPRESMSNSVVHDEAPSDSHSFRIAANELNSRNDHYVYVLPAGMNVQESSPVSQEIPSGEQQYISVNTSRQFAANNLQLFYGGMQGIGTSVLLPINQISTRNFSPSDANIPISHRNYSTTLEHYNPTGRLPTVTNPNAATMADILQYKRQELAAKAERLRQAELQIQQQELEAQHLAWLAMQEQELQLQQYEESLKQREAVAQMKMEECNQILNSRRSLINSERFQINTDNFSASESPLLSCHKRCSEPDSSVNIPEICLPKLSTETNLNCIDDPEIPSGNYGNFVSCQNKEFSDADELFVNLNDDHQDNTSNADTDDFVSEIMPQKILRSYSHTPNRRMLNTGTKLIDINMPQSKLAESSLKIYPSSNTPENNHSKQFSQNSDTSSQSRIHRQSLILNRPIMGNISQECLSHNTITVDINVGNGTTENHSLVNQPCLRRLSMAMEETQPEPQYNLKRLIVEDFHTDEHSKPKPVDVVPRRINFGSCPSKIKNNMIFINQNSVKSDIPNVTPVSSTNVWNRNQQTLSTGGAVTPYVSGLTSMEFEEAIGSLESENASELVDLCSNISSKEEPCVPLLPHTDEQLLGCMQEYLHETTPLQNDGHEEDIYVDIMGDDTDDNQSVDDSEGFGSFHDVTLKVQKCQQQTGLDDMEDVNTDIVCKDLTFVEIDKVCNNISGNETSFENDVFSEMTNDMVSVESDSELKSRFDGLKNKPMKDSLMSQKKQCTIVDKEQPHKLRYDRKQENSHDFIIDLPVKSSVEKPMKLKRSWPAENVVTENSVSKCLRTRSLSFAIQNIGVDEYTLGNVSQPILKAKHHKSGMKHKESEAKEIEVTCGQCILVLKNNGAFVNHADTKHMGLARPLGETQEFNTTQSKAILSDCLKRNKSLVCELCEKLFISVLGYMSHVKKCGIAVEDSKEMCDVCLRNFSSMSIKKHKLQHLPWKHGKQVTKCVNDEFLTSDTDLNLTSMTGKRKAALRCQKKLSMLASRGKIIDEESGSSVDNDDDYLRELKVNEQFTKVPVNAIPEAALTQWQREIEASKLATCISVGCEAKFASLPEAFSHHCSCRFAIPIYSYSCKLCEFVTDTKNTVTSHLTSIHSDQFTETDTDEDSSQGDDRVRIRVYGKKKLSPATMQVLFQAAIWTQKYILENYYVGVSLFPELTLNGEADLANVSSAQLHDYLPCDCTSPYFRINSSTDDGNWNHIDRFASVNYGDSSIMFCGGPVKASAWCPLPAKEVNTSQFLAISTAMNHTDEYLIHNSITQKGIIQIWECVSAVPDSSPKLVLGILHDLGNVWQISWCPSGVYGLAVKSSNQILGLLAVACSGGSVSIFCIPHPNSLKPGNGPFYFIKPCITLAQSGQTNQNIQCIAVDWFRGKGHSQLVGGFSDGTVCVWSLACSSLLINVDNYGHKTLYPKVCFQAHFGVCSAVAFCPNTKGRHIFTGGTDKNLRLWDLDSNMEMPMVNYHRGSIMAAVWLIHWSGQITSFDDAYSAFLSSTCYRYNNNIDSHGNFRNNTVGVLKCNTTVPCLSGSDWLNAVIQGDSGGQVLLTCLPDLKDNFGKCPKVSLPVISLSLQNINPTKLEDMDCLPSSFHEIRDRFGFVFTDHVVGKNSELISQLIGTNISLNPEPLTSPAHTSVNSVSWNNNVGAHSWVCIGTESGFVRLIDLKFLRIKNLEDIVGKS